MGFTHPTPGWHAEIAFGRWFGWARVEAATERYQKETAARAH